VRRPNRTEVLWLARHYYDEHAATVHIVLWGLLLALVVLGLDCHLSVTVSGTKVVAK
jgi:hypothetical protein